MTNDQTFLKLDTTLVLYYWGNKVSKKFQLWFSPAAETMRQQQGAQLQGPVPQGLPPQGPQLGMLSWPLMRMSLFGPWLTECNIFVSQQLWQCNRTPSYPNQVIPMI